MFWRKKKQNEAQYVEVDVRRLIELEAKMDKFEYGLNSIRGLVNRKLGNPSNEDESESDLKDDGLDSLRKLNNGSKISRSNI